MFRRTISRQPRQLQLRARYHLRGHALWELHECGCENAMGESPTDLRTRSQEVGLCLGAQAGEARIRDVVTAVGFSRFRRASETPFNIVYEARP